MLIDKSILERNSAGNCCLRDKEVKSKSLSVEASLKRIMPTHFPLKSTLDSAYFSINRWAIDCTEQLVTSLPARQTMDEPVS